jgi:UDPglucose 6-dehydrogenase
MKLVVVGTGHVGLVTAATLAAIRHDVVGLDEDEEKIALLIRGSSPFFEPGLEELVRTRVRDGTGRTPTHGPV